MSPTETVTQIAASVVDNLRSTPVILSLIVLNVIFMLVIFFAVRDVRKNHHDEMTLILQRCVPAVTVKG